VQGFERIWSLMLAAFALALLAGILYVLAEGV
jgi:hypothetical protein